MDGHTFQILNTIQAADTLDELHDRVARFNDRVILTRKGSDTRCVLISQAELEGLERAVEILSETNDGAALRSEILRIASVAETIATASSGSLA